MKKKFVLFFLLICSVFILNGCSDDDNNSTPPAEPETAPIDTVKSEADKTYTVMVLGCGGGNLDFEFAIDVPLLAKAISEKVNVVCQYNASAQLDTTETEGARPLGTAATTYRFKVTSDIDLTHYEDFRYKNASEVSLYKDSTVTDFINYAVDTCPADEYIIVLYNHGGGFNINDRAYMDYLLKAGMPPMMRNVLFDDNAGFASLSEKILSKAIANSKAPHMKAVYFYACNEGMVECYSELYRECDYIIGSAHVMSAAGHILPTLVKHLGNKNAASFEKKVEDFMEEIRRWWPDLHKAIETDPTAYNDDLSCVRASQMEPLNDLLKRIAARLCSNGFYTTHKEAIDSIHAHSVYRYYYWLPSYDVAHYIHLLAESTKDEQLVQMAQELDDLLPLLFVSRISVKEIADMPASITEYSLGINLFNKTGWESANTAAKEYYTTSVFAQQTGWYRWFEKIEGELSGWTAFK